MAMSPLGNCWIQTASLVFGAKILAARCDRQRIDHGRAVDDDHVPRR
jgi:hypothetical protein